MRYRQRTHQGRDQDGQHANPIAIIRRRPCRAARALTYFNIHSPDSRSTMTRLTLWYESDPRPTLCQTTERAAWVSTGWCGPGLREDQGENPKQEQRAQHQSENRGRSTTSG
jgi:hypothetical protein